jgi:hypothetical protein
MARQLKTHLLIGIPLAATLLLGAGAVYLHHVFFPTRFSGWGEVTAGRTISGWVVDRAGPLGPVEVQLYIDDRFAAHGLADLPRPDVSAAGWTKDARCGYDFKVPRLAAGEHEARVYAVHRVGGGGTHVTLQATGNPLRFRVGADGSVRPSD